MHILSHVYQSLSTTPTPEEAMASFVRLYRKLLGTDFCKVGLIPVFFHRVKDYSKTTVTRRNWTIHYALMQLLKSQCITW